jgi:hypothetical protein
MLDVSETYKIIIVVLRVISWRSLEGGWEGVLGVTRLSQRDVIYLGWPIASSYINSPKYGGRVGGGRGCRCRGSQPRGQLSIWSPNKLWRSNSIFNQWVSQRIFWYVTGSAEVLKGTQDWEFCWLRFWNLRFFFVSYVKILSLKKNFFDWSIIGGGMIFPRSPRTTREKNFELGPKIFFFFFSFGP